MDDFLGHKGYRASYAWDDSAGAYHGRVLGITDVVDFYGRDLDDLAREFQASVDAYLASRPAGLPDG